MCAPEASPEVRIVTDLPRIRVWPDPVLRVACAPVRSKEEIVSLLVNLFAIAHKGDLLGLAANQLGVSKQVFVWRRRAGTKQYFDIAINPRIVRVGKDKTSASEGCASLPGLTVTVARPRSVVVEYLDVDWQLIREALEFPEAAIFQHELDHLKGRYHIDCLDLRQRGSILQAWVKLCRASEQVTNVPVLR